MTNDEDDIIELPADEEIRARLQGGSTLHSYIELMRLPNVFTAMADVTMGFLFVQAANWRWNLWWDSWTLGLLIAASSLLYIAGVVLNDVFDFEIDRKERPERPLPSGRVAIESARRLGWRLLVLGVLLGSATAFFVGHFRPGIVAALLATCIVLYDAWLKRTPLGPVAMGVCRMLNILFGMNVLDASLCPEHWLVAGSIGVYVAGITWFARHEAATSSRVQLSLSTLIMALGISMLVFCPNWSQHVLPYVQQSPDRWRVMTSLLGLMIIWRCCWAVVDPIPLRVRVAVAQCVLSIVMLDALACYAARGVVAACFVLAFLLPAMFLGRWIETT